MRRNITVAMFGTIASRLLSVKTCEAPTHRRHSARDPRRLRNGSLAQGLLDSPADDLPFQALPGLAQ